MFNSLSGTITGKYSQRILIETQGIEWDVTVPEGTPARLPPVGGQGRVYTWLQHTEQLMVLFGFASEDDRALFFDLLKVDGIGPKGALKIMGGVASSDLVRILDAGDVEALQKVPGVGKKTAGKMLLQLKGRLSLREDSASPARRREDGPYPDVVAALTGMGYERKSAEDVVSRIAARLGTEAGFASQPVAAREDAVFRMAIVELAQ